MHRLLTATALLLVAIVAAGVLHVYGRYAEPYRGYPDSEQFVEIAPGSSTRAIGESLVGAGIVRDPLLFRIALWRTGAARQLKAGEYRFDSPMRVEEVVRKLARGDVFLRSITVPEGLTIVEMSRLFESAGLGSSDEFLAAAAEPWRLADLDPSARDLEGYLFPETYALPRRGDAARLVDMMVSRFREVFGGDLRRGAETRGLTVRQVVTLASIVEEETARSDERPVVAAVFLRRLKLRMPLQSDPTVIYGLQRIGRYRGNLTRENLAIDTPYNTYRRAGLPPGPISAPGLASLEAVVHPAEVDYLYFVSRNDGSHAFARTLAEHARNVLRYQGRPSRNTRGSR